MKTPKQKNKDGLASAWAQEIRKFLNGVALRKRAATGQELRDATDELSKDLPPEDPDFKCV
jgi:hypothetical protein